MHSQTDPGVVSAQDNLRTTFGTHRYELWLFGIALLLLNLPMLQNSFSDAFIFLPESVRSGEWWRLLTHPFVHVSWLHLLLDGLAFFILYSSLAEDSKARRLSCVAICAAGSLASYLVIAPYVESRGLCGLSGVAHGLMALSALEMMERDSARRVGLLCFATVVAKSVVESLCGHVLFESWYCGMLGSPVAICHAGGVLGGILAYLTNRQSRKAAARTMS